MSADTSGHSHSGPQASGPANSPDTSGTSGSSGDTGLEPGSCVGDGSGPVVDATGPDSSGSAGNAGAVRLPPGERGN